MIGKADSAAEALRIQQLQQYLPKPPHSAWQSFSEVLKTAGAVGEEVLSSAAGGIDGEFMDLINQQMEMQLELQRVSMLSNIERSEHEAKMAPIRNIRLS